MGQLTFQKACGLSEIFMAESSLVGNSMTRKLMLPDKAIAIVNVELYCPVVPNNNKDDKGHAKP